jgi:hypothetical protein
MYKTIRNEDEDEYIIVIIVDRERKRIRQQSCGGTDTNNTTICGRSY